MSNLSILERNICHAFEAFDSSDEMDTLFLRAKHVGALKAERLALEWGELAPFLDHALPAAAQPFGGDDAVIDDVRAFIRERHFRRCVPGNRDQ